MKSNNGFTLVELMVSIVLGLIIVAAGTQLFMTGLISVNLQKAMSEIQDNSNFGLNYIATDLRKANYNAEKSIVTGDTKFGGIVLSDKNFPNDLTGIPSAKLLTLAHAESTANQLTNKASDQLVIQYYVSEDVIDCEGNIVAADSMLIQRYFIDQGALKCDSGYYPRAMPTEKDKNNVVKPYVLTGFNSKAQILLKNVEYMHILLAVSEDNGAAGTNDQAALPKDGIAQKNLRYISIDNYPMTGSQPRIRGVQLGLLMKSSESVSGTKELEEKNKSTFRVLDEDVSLTTKDKKYLHQVVTQTIALRNALGASS